MWSTAHDSRTLCMLCTQLRDEMDKKLAAAEEARRAALEEEAREAAARLEQAKRDAAAQREAAEEALRREMADMRAKWVRGAPLGRWRLGACPGGFLKRNTTQGPSGASYHSITQCGCCDLSCTHIAACESCPCRMSALCDPPIHQPGA